MPVNSHLENILLNKDVRIIQEGKLLHDINISQVRWNSLIVIFVSCISHSLLSIELAKGFILNYTFQNCIELMGEFYALSDPMVLVRG